MRGTTVEAIAGTVTILEGTRTVATGPVTAGHALVTLPQQTIGSHSLHAVYSGASDYLTSSSATAALTVHQAISRTALTASATKVKAGTAITLKAVTTVLAPGVSAINGTVTFYDGSTSLGTYPTHGTVSRGSVRPTAGAHRYRAVFHGSPTLSTSLGVVIVNAS